MKLFAVLNYVPCCQLVPDFVRPQYETRNNINCRSGYSKKNTLRTIINQQNIENKRSGPHEKSKHLIRVLLVQYQLCSFIKLE